MHIEYSSDFSRDILRFQVWLFKIHFVGMENPMRIECSGGFSRGILRFLVVYCVFRYDQSKSSSMALSLPTQHGLSSFLLPRYWELLHPRTGGFETPRIIIMLWYKI